MAATPRAFAGLLGASLESPSLIAKALDRMENGMGFADALHLGTAARCELPPTFDRSFIEFARDAPVNMAES